MDVARAAWPLLQATAAATAVRELSGALGDLARAPGEVSGRRRAADRALGVARRRPPDGPLWPALVRLVAADIVGFAGVDATQSELHVASPPHSTRSAAALHVVDLSRD